MIPCNYNIPEDCSRKLNITNKALLSVKKDNFAVTLLKHPHFAKYFNPKSIARTYS